MAGGSIGIRLDTGSIGAAFRGLQKLGREPRPMLQAIGAAVAETTIKRFESGTDPQGTHWAAWSPAYAEVTKSNSILRGRGGSSGLMDSINYQVEGGTVRVGSNKVYAAVHQFGATIVPVRAKALVFHLGERMVFAKKVHIPARPYLGFGPADRLAVVGVARTFLAEALAARKDG